jgi:hypothetical protein
MVLEASLSTVYTPYCIDLFILMYSESRALLNIQLSLVITNNFPCLIATKAASQIELDVVPLRSSCVQCCTTRHYRTSIQWFIHLSQL